MKDKRNIFLEGKKVILRPLNKETDLQLCYEWINDREIMQFLNRVFPISFTQEESWFDSRDERDDIILAIEQKDKLGIIGTMGLHRIDWVSRIGTAGALIGDKDLWGKGLGTDAQLSVLGYAFEALNLQKVEASCWAFNHRSHQHLQKCGYRKEGRLKKHIFRNGKYYDQILMAVFKKDWQKAWNRHYSD